MSYLFAWDLKVWHPVKSWLLTVVNTCCAHWLATACGLVSLWIMDISVCSAEPATLRTHCLHSAYIQSTLTADIRTYFYFNFRIDFTIAFTVSIIILMLLSAVTPSFFFTRLHLAFRIING